MPSSFITSSDSPALLSCFLALKTLGKVVPATLTTLAFVSGSIVPTTLGVSDAITSSSSTVTPVAAFVKVASVNTGFAPSLKVPVAESNVTSVSTFVTSVTLETGGTSSGTSARCDGPAAVTACSVAVAVPAVALTKSESDSCLTSAAIVSLTF